MDNENKVLMSLGKKFSSFPDVQSTLKKYENIKKQKFWIRNSRTLNAAKKIGITRSCNMDLKYYEVQFNCIHGGLKFKPRGTGQRSTKTFKKDCPACIRLRVTKDGQHLEVVKILENHLNHENSGVLFDHLPQVKRLEVEDEADVIKCLKLGCNKKLMQSDLVRKGKKTTLKDLSNIQTSLKSGECNDLQSCVELLKNTYSADIDVLHEENHLKALFFTTPEMRQVLHAWPEFVALDGTYKLINNDLTVYIVLVEDGGGNSEVAGVALLASEDRDSIHWLLDTFKTKNQSAEGVQCFMTDKDLLQRDVIKEVFPGVATYICLFHTLKIFNREVSCQKLNISQQERTTSLELLSKLVYSSTNEDYDITYNIFSKEAPPAVLTYFNKNWHSIKEEWTVCNMKNGNLNNRTNNRLESINNKIKQVVAKNSSFSTFIKSFFHWLNSFHTERNNRLVKEFLKANITIFKKGSVEDKYSKLLTQYSYDYTLKSLAGANHVTLKEQNGVFEVRHGNENISVSENHCTCSNFSSMFLPCKHIFAVKKYLNKSLFCPELCHKRWKKEYYFHNNRYFLKPSKDLAETTIYCNNSSQKKALSVTQKRSKATDLCNKIVSDLIQSSTSQFLYRFEILKKIESIWRNGEEVAVQQVIAHETDHGNNVVDEVDDSMNEVDDEMDVHNSMNNVDEMDDHNSINDVVDEMDDNSTNVDVEMDDHNSMNKSMNAVTDKINDKNMGSKIHLEEETTNSADVKKNILNAIIVFNNEEVFDACSNNYTEVFESGKLGEEEEDGAMLAANKFHDTGYLASCINKNNETDHNYTKTVVNNEENFDSNVNNSINNSKDILTISEESCVLATVLNEENISGNINALSDIKIPAKFKKRGRPSGADTTVIGLKKKKMKKQPSRFQDKSYHTQLQYVLENIVQPELIPQILDKSYTVSNSDLKDDIGHAVMSDDIELEMVKDYVTNEALQNLKLLKSTYLWNCSFCKKTLGSDPNIMCDSCLSWYHFACVGLCREPQTKNWFCRNCF